MSDMRVEVRGLPALNRALKQVADQSPGAMKEGFARIAEGVVGKIRPKVPIRSGRARGSLKARGSTRGGAIAFGGTAAPHYPWLDFGGRVGRGRSIARQVIKEGRYVYPTISEEGPTIRRETDELIGDLAKKAGFETRGRG